MIQRIQSIYLLISIVLLLTVSALGLFGLLNHGDESCFPLVNRSLVISIIVPLLLLDSAVVTCLSLFCFKNRKKQIKLINYVQGNIVVAYLVYFVSVLIFHNTLNVTLLLFFPLLAFAFNLMASRAIKSDERLVRSADRLR